MNQGNNAECAVTYFKNGFCCSQSVFAALSPQYGMERGETLKLAAPFCGGMGRMAKTCGAVTGAFLVIGLARGSEEAHIQAREEIYALVRAFAERFTEKNGSLECRDLIGCDIGTPEGHREAEEKNLFQTVCERLVRDAVEIVEEVLRMPTAGR